MPAVTDQIISLNGLRLRFRDWPGPATPKDTIVLLHGLSGHAHTWDALARKLAANYRVLALDQRGHGASDWAPPKHYGTDDMVADLTAFVAALGLEAFSLLGLSMGGRVTIQYAGTQPHGLRRAVIVEAAPEIEAAGMQSLSQNLARNDTFASIEEAFAQARATNATPPEAHHLERVRHGLMLNADGYWTYRYDPVLRSGAPRKFQSPEESWASVARINVPTLVVRGANSDLIARTTAEHMCATMRQAEFVEVAGAGHSVPLDKPTEFAAAVTSFFTRTDSV